MRRAFLQDARAVFERGLDWSGLAGDSLAFALATAHGHKPWLIVTDEPDEAERLVLGLKFFLREGKRVMLFPADDSRPYDGFSPSSRLGAQRGAVLDAVAEQEAVLVVAPARALLSRIPSRVARRESVVALHVGLEIDRDELVRRLLAAGYLSTAKVAHEGCLAVRGDLVDVWPSLRARPVRIDFFDDEIEGIRELEPGETGTRRALESLRIVPAREVRLDPQSVERLAVVLNQEVERQDRGVPLRRRVIEDAKQGIWFSGIEDYLPAFLETQSPLEAFDALEKVVVSPDDVAAVLREFERSAASRWTDQEADERPLLPPSARYEAASTVLEALAGARNVWSFTAGDRAVQFDARPVESLSVRGGELGPVASKLKRFAADELRIGLVAQSAERATALTELFAPHDLALAGAASPWLMPQGRVALLVGTLQSGFIAPDSGWAFIPASAIFGRKRRSTEWDRANAFFEAALTSTTQLKERDYVVHRRHGVGRYQGMRRIAVGEGAQDFVCLEYLRGDQLLLPVTRLGQISRYRASSDKTKVRLDRLGGATWERRTKKVRDSLFQMANELLRLYAKRELATREVFEESGSQYKAFEGSFEFQETPDQLSAIAAVQEDLGAPQPMDRLLCGDVGFGKTEVAMRAAMRVVEGGKQVAVLCPTTVLAYQHYQTFTSRFEGFPVNIGMLSRFNSPAETRKVLGAVATGGVDIVIGTTSILGREVSFVDLGLVVIDEEHRFGVRQKERLKKLRASVDILSMSATPIPRTLQMAMGGLRDMSIMATPPRDRLSVRTSVAKMTETRVRDAILEEVSRDGQAFFIHNRVETIARMTERLEGWVPGVRFGFAHGQMDSSRLEKVLVDFVRGEIQVLVCTSIVENGVDIPNVNTMLVHRADQFGLAQLYQLRGRVGRSSVRARCVLFAPEEITRDARKRLRVLVENTELGAGFQVASADLEIRGGGNLVGAAQSGNIDAVGFETWVELLAESVAVARGEQERSQIDPELTIPVSAFIPDGFIRDSGERLSWYRRFSRARVDEIEGLLDHFEEEFGEAPEEVRNLAGMVEVRLQCVKYGILRCHWLKVRAILNLVEEGDRAPFEQLVAAYPKRFRWAKKDQSSLELRFTPRESSKPFHYLRWVFAQLGRNRS
jgi:transcription-repair coupling factor (superfamily II helicase)